MADQLGDYSRLDQFLHKLAFSGSFVQQTLTELEDSLFGKELATASSRNPIFITSLPRAGTTVLLTALSELPGLASHIYRDMPFVMAPFLWSKLSGPFQKNRAAMERAHGDGIQIGYDSPEAFEEILWRKFWPHKYLENRIELWTESDFSANAREFFRRHFAKIVALRCQGDTGAGRYISKNNANIARLDIIPRLFPDAKIVLPIRRPIEHAASMHRQHLNFLEQHKSNAFTKRYMHDIGHLEFGELHQPMQFPGMAETIGSVSPMSLDYWLLYWVAAFRYVAEREDQLIIVPHEQVCGNSLATIKRVLGELNIEDSEMLDRAVSHFDPAAARARRHPEHSNAIRKQADALYQSLSERWTHR